MALVLAVSLAGTVQAATISYVGADVDGTKGAWRTTSVAKPLDLDSDNVYGTAGYLMPIFDYHTGTMPAKAYNNTSSEPYRLNPSVATLEWAHTDWGGVFGDFNDGQWYNPMDNPVEEGTFGYGGMWSANGFSNDFVRITLTSAATFRLGVWIDGQNQGEFAADLTVKTSDGAIADTVAPTAANAQIDWYFWDITGAAGDVFIVAAANSGAYVDIGGVTVDIIPEPATVSLLVVGGLTALLKRRRIS